ncbi:unnamed protein product [Ectocarpus sp. CCAP 1310/34]|nr:unnamed protein product [Ectocarpus sp. CCAP 1310/34]
MTRRKDGSKSGERSNYRRAQHHITAFWSAFMALCREEYLKGTPTRGDTPVEDDEVVDEVIRWIEARAKAHKTFAVWKQFLLHEYPAYIAFRTALRTGNFRLRLDALCRIAPIFYITVKDKYQFLVVDHLTDVSRGSQSSRQDADERDPFKHDREAGTDAPAAAAIDCLRESPAFKGDDGKDKVVALDGRVFPPVKWQEILNSHDKATAKLRECVLKKIFSIPARNSTNKATESQGRSSALKDTVGNTHTGGEEWKAWALNVLDAAREGGGVVTQDQMLKMVGSIGAATPYSMANATGGEGESVRISNEVAGWSD